MVWLAVDGGRSLRVRIRVFGRTLRRRLQGASGDLVGMLGGMPIPLFVQELRRKLGDDLLFLPGVAAVVFDDGGRVLLARRADTKRWAVVGGIVEPGEEPADCCVREVLE